jgi:peptidoglycan/LPS O-acetylase OafA/YrhL
VSGSRAGWHRGWGLLILVVSLGGTAALVDLVATVDWASLEALWVIPPALPFVVIGVVAIVRELPGRTILISLAAAIAGYLTAAAIVIVDPDAITALLVAILSPICVTVIVVAVLAVSVNAEASEPGQ